MAEADRWLDQLRPLVQDRPVVIVAPSTSAAVTVVEDLRRLGAGPVLIVGGRAGAVTARPDDAAVVDLGIRPVSLLDDIRAVHAALASPPEAVRAAVETFDPDRRALVMGDSFNEATEFLGRPFLAHRRPAWVALEDKTVVDALWDRAGVAREPSAIVALDRASIDAARAALDRGAGVVVSADASSGWHGGAVLVRHLAAAASADDVAALVEEFGASASKVRVMPFVPGVPSSIHGIVLPDRVVALRPVEMLVLERPDGRFFYAGCATFHDPTPSDRTAMRDVARRVGRRLREEVGFRGAFTVDGILGRDGFRPTELNPRSGAGLRPLLQAVDLPMSLFLDALVAGSPIDWRGEELERFLVGTADRHRAGSTYREFPVVRPEDQGELVLADGRFRRPAVGEQPDLRYELGPGGFGSFVRGFPVVERRPVGLSFAPVAAAFWRWADHEFDLAIGPLLVPDDLGRPGAG